MGHGARMGQDGTWGGVRGHCEGSEVRGWSMRAALLSYSITRVHSNEWAGLWYHSNQWAGSLYHSNEWVEIREHSNQWAGFMGP